MFADRARVHACRGLRRRRRHAAPRRRRCGWPPRPTRSCRCRTRACSEPGLPDGHPAVARGHAARRRRAGHAADDRDAVRGRPRVPAGPLQPRSTGSTTPTGRSMCPNCGEDVRPGGGAPGGIRGYPVDQLNEEVAFLAYHFHWPHDELMALEHRDRRGWVARGLGDQRTHQRDLKDPSQHPDDEVEASPMSAHDDQRGADARVVPSSPRAGSPTASAAAHLRTGDRTPRRRRHARRSADVEPDRAGAVTITRRCSTSTVWQPSVALHVTHRSCRRRPPARWRPDTGRPARLPRPAATGDTGIVAGSQRTDISSIAPTATTAAADRATLTRRGRRRPWPRRATRSVHPSHPSGRDRRGPAVGQRRRRLAPTTEPALRGTRRRSRPRWPIARPRRPAVPVPVPAGAEVDRITDQVIGTLDRRLSA